MWKKTFKTIRQLSCFVGHPVLAVTMGYKAKLLFSSMVSYGELDYEKRGQKKL